MSETPQTPPPPEPPTPGASGGSNRPASSIDGAQVKAAFQGANQFDLGIMAAGVLTFIFSLFDYYKASGSAGAFGGGSESWSAWHGFFGWFGALAALAGAVLLLLGLFNVKVLEPALRRTVVLGAFAVATLCTFLAIFVNPLPGHSESQTVGGVTYSYSKGHGFSFWICLILVIVGLVLAFLRKDARD
jgi:hypothetical protein